MRDNAMTDEKLGAKLLQSVQEMKAGKATRVTRVEISQVTRVRQRSQNYGITKLRNYGDTLPFTLLSPPDSTIP
jgi:hypothetical protein